MKRQIIAIAAISLIGLIGAAIPRAQLTNARYRSPIDACYSPAGDLIAVADHTAGAVAFVDPARGVVVRRAAVSSPWSVIWSGKRTFATEFMTGNVAEIDPATGTVVRRIRVGAYPRALAAADGGKTLLVANSGSRDISIVRLADGKERGRLTCTGVPSGIAVSPDGGTAVVAYLNPTSDATNEKNSARVALFNLAGGTRTAEIALPSGSAGLRDVAVTSDGRWALVPHALGRYNLPTTQLDRGWVNTNALSILDLKAQKLYATVLLDQTQEGAADPWGVQPSKDGTRVWITLAGAQQLASLDFKGMMKLIAGGLPDDSPLNQQSPEWAATMRNVWQEIKADPSKRSELVNDLAALYIADLIQRVPVPGNGPRGLTISPDGQTLAIAQYFTGDLALTDRNGKVKKIVSLGPSPKPDAVRDGERMFHDGRLCFQHWLSCATCHPDGRADGLNWDLLNDGMGNPKNTRSLLLAHKRGPMMSHGVRASVTVATRAGFRFILFREPKPSEVETTEAYIRSMTPLPSPHRLRNADGSFGGLSPRAVAGKAIFESPKTKCAKCHNGPVFTDKRLHDVDTRGPYDSDGRFITPTLVEVWRTAPYLHDGRAVTMREVFTKFNRTNRHGDTSHLTPKQIDDLSEYVLSL
jgi:DNA-binding beta-propeller fold protein YncE